MEEEGNPLANKSQTWVEIVHSETLIKQTLPKVLAVLENCIVLVTLSDDTNETDEKDEKDEIAINRAPIAKMLNDHNNALEKIIQRLENLITRIDL